MAETNFTQLTQLPWPAFISASLILHVGALVASLPVILQVDAPPDNSVTIPVTLVGEGDMPVAAVDSPPPDIPPAEAPLQQPNALGGQDPAVEPTNQNQGLAQQAPPQNGLAQKPEPEAVNTDPSENPTTKPNNGTESSDGTTTENPPASDHQTHDTEKPQNPESAIGDGAIAISIVGTSTVPPGTPGDWPDVLPTLQSASALSVTDHTCNNALPAGEVTLGLVIAADGSVIQVFAPPDEDTMSAQIASCLLTHALSVNPAAIRFAPAYTGQQAIITDRMQLTLRFSPG
ncbi:hypothetical protein QGP82_33055 [Leptothoe sp. LEGE 181152]|uniref:Uncharacterized protein n=1 Tax=Adonisia turfae CCMR0081 TaxID=2292702 RepID=A0A6M0RKL7_9CYAN|nr:hypothetical protein [Adonisia turfae]MDV3353550.1 hypothetical protein [Leptothoe sp. LEGE 181152]NEZ56808.1 hypothetical protein [Adonisia turfae CCMR0081]